MHIPHVFLVLDLFLDLLHSLLILKPYILQKGLAPIRFGVDGPGLFLFESGEQERACFYLIVFVADVDIGEADLVGMEFSDDGVGYLVHLLSLEGAILPFLDSSLDLQFPFELLLLFLLFVLFKLADGLLYILLEDEDFLASFVHLLLSLVVHLLHQFGSLFVFG